MLDVSEVVGVDVLAELLVVAIVGREVGWVDDGQQPFAAVAASSATAAPSAWVVGAKPLTLFGHLVSFGVVPFVSAVAVFASSAFAKLRRHLHVREVDASHLVDAPGALLTRVDGVEVVLV